jgi:hypothetical protein
MTIVTSDAGARSGCALFETREVARDQCAASPRTRHATLEALRKSRKQRQSHKKLALTLRFWV